MYKDKQYFRNIIRSIIYYLSHKLATFKRFSILIVFFNQKIELVKKLSYRFNRDLNIVLCALDGRILIYFNF